VMGAKVTVIKSLMKREVNIYYYKIRRDLSDSAISDLFRSNPSKKQYELRRRESLSLKK
jgi:hypothetical protein